MATKQGESGTKVFVNFANKERKKERPYASWTDPRTGWKYRLCKSWQAHNNKPFARWFMWMEGYDNEYGDTYVAELLGGLRNADDLVFDGALWADRKAFLAWARGEG